MSVLTEVLKLFKYDPATDGDMTFNIGQCMNDNWDKLDAAILLAIAAAGAYNPEESYAVGDYCTYKGKLHKCSTAIPTGETWTEAHWTTTTVAAELAELSSQLSNLAGVHKARTYTDLSQIGITMGQETIENVSMALPNGSILIYSAGDSANTSIYPYRFCSVIVYKMDPSRVVWFGIDKTSGNMQCAAWSSDLGFKGWNSYVTQAIPQEFDLPLASGVTSGGTCTYAKMQDGLVVIRCSIVLTEALSASEQRQIFSLPAGFRPSSTFQSFVLRGDTIKHASLSISTGGNAVIVAKETFAQSDSRILFPPIVYFAAS